MSGVSGRKWRIRGPVQRERRRVAVAALSVKEMLDLDLDQFLRARV
ncbi:MAG TPA: hypothetical protein VN253_27330 [Kofleriaceae bacterium]|nr:hypothetical protein [Kofleriaceae bacterium]